MKKIFEVTVEFNVDGINEYKPYFVIAENIKNAVDKFSSENPDIINQIVSINTINGEVIQ